MYSLGLTSFFALYDCYNNANFATVALINASYSILFNSGDISFPVSLPGVGLCEAGFTAAEV